MVDAKEIDDLMSELQVEASKFKTNAESVKGLLVHADSRLAAVSPGLEYWLPHDIEATETFEITDDDDGHTLYSYYEAYRIGYARLGERWGLAVRTVEVKETGTERTTTTTAWHRLGETYSMNRSAQAQPIENAPLAVRIAALDLFTDLSRNLISAMKTRNQSIERAASLLKPKK